MTGRVVVGVLAIAVASCSGPGGTQNAGTTEVAIYAAASLQAALVAAKDAYQADHPGIAMTLAFNSSAALRTQIEQGAPADLFLSADTTSPQELVDAGLTDGAARNFAGNSLAIVVPIANPGAVTSPVDLSRAGLKVIAAGDAVPISGYAKALISRLSGLPGYPAGFVASYDANVLSREDNVKGVLTKIELGEGDAGIVYATDARSSTKVTTIPTPPEASVTAVYAGVTIKGSAHPAETQRILDWLAGPAGQSVLAGFGFVAPP
ncbi:MAG TPA: molybdate ABC transporter substrate-binding protein [Candidatus Limnocylindrales bacterium]|nr:molybdate ABC transporter substrate-binding protein [Candidatus Limnocylindrales bacterium]